MHELNRPRGYATHSQMVAESLDRQRKRKMLRDWVNEQQNPMAGRRRPGRIEALWARWDVDMRVGMAGVACLFALGAILRVWG